MTGDCEEEVLGAVIFDGGLACEGGGGESEDAGGGEGSEVHDCGVGLRKWEDVVWFGWLVFVDEKRGLICFDDSCLLAGLEWSSYTFLTCCCSYHTRPS